MLHKPGFSRLSQLKAARLLRNCRRKLHFTGNIRRDRYDPDCPHHHPPDISKTFYRSRTYIDVENTPLLQAPKHAIVNASATFTLPADNVSLRFAVDNLTKQRVPVAGYDGSAAFGFVEAYFNDPRRWSVSLGYKF